MKIFVLLFQGELEKGGGEPVRPVMVASDLAADELKHDNVVVCHLSSTISCQLLHAIV